MRKAYNWYPFVLMGLILLLTSSIVACQRAPSSAPPSAAKASNHNTNSELGFSFDYRKGWIFKELNPNEIGVAPPDETVNQIQIGAYPGEPILDTMPKELIVTSTEAAVKMFCDALGGTDFRVRVNEPASGKVGLAYCI